MFYPLPVRCVLMLMAFVTPVSARGDVVTEVLPYAHEGEVLSAYLASDNDLGEAKRPAVLVCHAWWGAGDYAQQRARALAELGYVALVLDMYGDFETTDDPAVAQSLAEPFYQNRDRFRTLAQAGLDLLLEQPGVDPDRVAVVGYCFGGTTALELAYSGAPLVGVVTFHGSLLDPQPAVDDQLADLDLMTAKVLICHGQADPLYPIEKLVALVDALQAGGIDTTTTMYSGAKHAFTDPGADAVGFDGVAYNATADRRSWAAMKDFLEECFGE